MPFSVWTSSNATCRRDFEHTSWELSGVQSRTARRQGLKSQDTFEARGRRLGLSDEFVIETLCRAITVAGPAIGGWFVSPIHRIGDDETSRVALAELDRLSHEGGRVGAISQPRR